MAKEIRKCTESDISISLINFIQGINVVETKIGEYTSNIGSKEKDLICFGHIVEEQGGSGTWIYAPIESIQLAYKPKFETAFDKTAEQLIYDYYAEKLNSISGIGDVSIEEKIKDIRDSYIEKVRDIEKDKLVLMPFKPGNRDIEVTIECEETVITKQMKLVMLRWVIDKDTGGISCNLYCEGRFPYLTKRFECKVEEYGSRYTIGAMKLSTAGSKIKSSDIIEMTPAGYIKPFEIVYKDVSVIVDGTYMYMLKSGVLAIVGEWGDNGMQTYKSFNDKAYNKMKQCLIVLALHRKYIAPYKLIDTKKLEI